MITVSDWTPVEKCSLCGSTSFRTDFRFTNRLGLVPPARVVTCEGCNLRRLNPRPSDQDLDKLYSYDNYFDNQGPLEYSQYIEKRLAHFRNRINKIKNYLHKPSPPPILLEIGAATGEFLALASEAGFETHGIELSEGAREKALKTHGITLTDTPTSELPDNSFDVIHMNHVLEHLPDPGQTISECFRLLKNNGILCLEVPNEVLNDLDRVRYFLGRRKKVMDSHSLHHSYFFTPETLSSLVRKGGFETVSLSTFPQSLAPLRPFELKNLVLKVGLTLSDVLHSNGTVVEYYGRKPRI